MDIHRPKAAHSIREFLIEIGTIICGILIALGLEQGIEWVHWREQVQQARETLHAEITDNVNVLRERLSDVTCVNNRLAEVRTILAEHAKGGSLRLLAPVARPRDSAIYTNASSAALTAGALVHMPLEERKLNQRLYDGFRFVADLQLSERSTWGILSLLDEQEILTAADWPLITRAYAEAKNLNQRFSTGLPGLLREAERAGFVGTTRRPNAVIGNVCDQIFPRP